MNRQIIPVTWLIAASISLTTMHSHGANNESEWEWQCATGENQQWVCTKAPKKATQYVTAKPIKKKTPATDSDEATKRSESPTKIAESTTSSVTSEPAIVSTIPTKVSDFNKGHWLDWVPSSELTAEQKLQTPSACPGGWFAPENPGPEAGTNPEFASTLLSSDSTSMDPGVRTDLNGNVTIFNGKRQGYSDSATLWHEKSQIDLNGSVKFREPGLLIYGDKAVIHSDTGTGSFYNTRFVLHEDHARGSAKTINRLDGDVITLEQTVFSRCPPGDSAWKLAAKNIELNQATGVGKARNAKIYVADVPVFYFPYIEFPIDDRRKSGFLWPSISTGNGGDISAPYYFNIAPNMDATLAPRFIGSYGAMLEGELRYLNRFGTWDLSGAFLPNSKDDSEWIDDPSVPGGRILDTKNSGNNRWLGHFEHRGNLSQYWSTSIDYTAVSDEDYFRDLNAASLNVSRQSHLKQSAKIEYNDTLWQFSAETLQYQTIDEGLAEPYRELPRLEFNYLRQYQPFTPEVFFNSEYTFFEHDEKLRGQRLYAETGVGYLISGTAGQLDTTIRVKHLNYDLNESNLAGAAVRPKPAGSDLDGHPSVTVPSFRTEGHLNFERELTIFDSPYLQTLKPGFIYQYTDYEKQTDIPTFDTGQPEFSQSQLMAENRFTGLDRIGDTNHLTLGIGTDFIDSRTGKEKVSAFIGQMLYFNDREVTHNGRITEVEQRSNSPVVANLDVTLNDNFRLLTATVWDPYDDEIENFDIHMQYQVPEKILLNLGYTYDRELPQNYRTNIIIPGSVPPTTMPITEIINKDIEQGTFSTIVPINYQWSFFSQWRYDLTNHYTLEDLTGFQYDDCCWRVRVAYQRSVDAGFRRFNIPNDLRREYDYNFFIEFQLKGLGGIADRLSGLIEDSIPGSEQWYLNGN